MAPRIAFFDLDHTLLAQNSAVAYACTAFRRGYLSLIDLSRSALWAGLHWLGRLDLEVACQRAGELFRGVPGEQMRLDVGAWFEQELAGNLRPGGRAALARHRQRGERTVLVTSSSGYIAEAASRAFGLDAWLANESVLDDDGLITGVITKPICYGSGKVERARAFALAERSALEDAYFYSDSISDLPLLQSVRYPHVVHPDPRLRIIAHQRRWPIHDWSR